jgi:hypothetical protein
LRDDERRGADDAAQSRARGDRHLELPGHVGGHHRTELFVLAGSLRAVSTSVGGSRATDDTLTIDYSVLPVDDFGPRADMN